VGVVPAGHRIRHRVAGQDPQRRAQPEDPPLPLLRLRVASPQRAEPHRHGALLQVVWRHHGAARHRLGHLLEPGRLVHVEVVGIRGGRELPEGLDALQPLAPPVAGDLRHDPQPVEADQPDHALPVGARRRPGLVLRRLRETLGGPEDEVRPVDLAIAVAVGDEVERPGVAPPGDLGLAPDRARDVAGQPALVGRVDEDLAEDDHGRELAVGRDLELVDAAVLGAVLDRVGAPVDGDADVHRSGRLGVRDAEPVDAVLAVEHADLAVPRDREARDAAPLVARLLPGVAPVGRDAPEVRRPRPVALEPDPAVRSHLGPEVVPLRVDELSPPGALAAEPELPDVRRRGAVEPPAAVPVGALVGEEDPVAARDHAGVHLGIERRPGEKPRRRSVEGNERQVRRAGPGGAHEQRLGVEPLLHEVVAGVPGDAHGLAARRVHHEGVVGSVAVAVEGDSTPVRRPPRGALVGRVTGQPPGLPALGRRDPEVPPVLEDDLAPVR
jgi:hypothetical protein